MKAWTRIQQRLPFINTREKAFEAVQRIEAVSERDAYCPIVFTTLVDDEISTILETAPALCLNFFKTFLAPIEAEINIKSTHTVGRTHGRTDSSDYKNRIEAINYTLAHDDGITDRDLSTADVILVGVSRCGKTPTSLYLAMQFGLKAANFPLIPEDFERGVLPGRLKEHKAKLFGLTIQPERLAQIREERRPNSKYASLANCRQEVADAGKDDASRRNSLAGFVKQEHRRNLDNRAPGNPSRQPSVFLVAAHIADQRHTLISGCTVADAPARTDKRLPPH